MLVELGERLAAARLGRNLTQLELARRAGVARSAVQQLEGGGAVTTTTLIRVLRELDALDALDALIPPPAPSPLAALRLRGRPRRRAGRSRSSAPAAEQPWRWGDER